MKPGRTVRITLNNRLEDDLNKTDCTNHQNIPNCFNGTNLHAHGLWISPSGNSDNVLLEIKPGAGFQYEYNVPADHPAGTFWYHPHIHGSTAVQVASGMAGALIIQGERPPLVDERGLLVRPGDIDVLLKPFKKDDAPEVMLFQQIPYGCFDSANKLKQYPPETQGGSGRWKCEAGDTGEVKDFGTQLGAGKWKSAGRYTSVNGSVHFKADMEAGHVYRWRLIDAGIHEPIGLRITKVKAGTEIPQKYSRGMGPDEEEKLVKDCEASKEVVSQFEIASDGLTREKIERRDRTMLQPGYRSDVLFAFPSEGTYCVYDAAARTDPPTGPVPEAKEGPKLLGLVTVKGGMPFSQDQGAFIKNKLITAAMTAFEKPIQTKVIADLQGLKTAMFAPHKPFSGRDLNDMDENKCVKKNGRATTNKEWMTLKESQCVSFYVGANPTKDPQELKDRPVVFQINGQAFDSSNLPRTLQLGYKQKWVLSSSAGDHPFHIHVNPFQIVKILKKNGDTDVYEEIPDVEAYYKQNKNDKTKAMTEAAYYNYVGMKGAWKDTIFVMAGYKIIVATQYRRYIGDFVFHCHLLDHEDQGMMESVSIVLPDAEGNPVPSAHAGH